MTRPRVGEHRLIWLSPQAFAATEELAQGAGMTVTGFIEAMLVELLAHHRSECREHPPSPTQPNVVAEANVVSIGQAQGRRRIRRRPGRIL